MRYLKTSEAAALLKVSPNTLRAWERRFGFPKPQRSPGKHRLFTHGEIASLRDALQEGLSISSAVSRVREGLAADANSLVGALVSYEGERADAGIDVLSLSARGVGGIGDAVAVHRPNLVVVAGSHLDDDAVARWAYAIRLAGGAVPVAVYRRGSDRGRVRTTGTRNLPPGAGAA